MAIKNYTTDVPVNKTVSEIHLMLADHGAKRILFDYGADSKVTAITATASGASSAWMTQRNNATTFTFAPGMKN